MRKPVVLTLAIFLFSSALGRAIDCPGCSGDCNLARIECLHKLAQDKSNPSLLARTCAIEALGQCKPKDCQTEMFLKDVFRELLTKPNVEEYQKNYFLWQVAKALQTPFGTHAKDLVCDLCTLKGRDCFLDNAIAAAVKAIQTPPSAAVAAPPDSDALNKQLGKLTAAAATLDARIAAAKVLDSLLNQAKAADAAKFLVSPDLLTAIKSEDASTGLLAAKAGKTAFDGAKKAASSAERDAYLASLTKMLGDGKKATNDTLPAIVALGELGADAAPTLQTLQNFATSATDTCIKRLAADAVTRIKSSL